MNDSLRPLPNPEIGEHMTIEEFVACVEHDLYGDRDGVGRLATADGMSDIEFTPSQVDQWLGHAKWTHVVWFNK